MRIDQAIIDYKRLGYSDAWINQRIKSIEVRKGLTDEWKCTGVQERLEYNGILIYSHFCYCIRVEYIKTMRYCSLFVSLTAESRRITNKMCNFVANF